MAWIYGNDPSATSEQIRQGRVLCEAMYAINERQYCCNIAATAWPEVGAYPAVNALAGKDVTIARLQALIVAMRAAIDVIAASFATTDIRFFTAGEYSWVNCYTKASLLTEAFGAADWCALTGKDINDVQPVTEILKAVELLTHAGYTNRLAGGPYNKHSDKDWVGGVVGTPALARAQCDAQAPAAWAADLVMGDYNEFITAVPPNYNRYYIREEVDRLDVYIPLSAAIGTASAWYGTAGTIHDTAGTKLIYEITAGIFAAPGWGAEGNLRHTLDEIPAAAATWKIETLDDASFLSTGTNTYYLKTIEDVATPFVDDDTDQGCRIILYGLYFDLTFTYN